VQLGFGLDAPPLPARLTVKRGDNRMAKATCLPYLSNRPGPCLRPLAAAIVFVPLSTQLKRRNDLIVVGSIGLRNSGQCLTFEAAPASLDGVARNTQISRPGIKPCHDCFSSRMDSATPI